MLASPTDRKRVSNLALRSSEWQAPAAGRRSRTRLRSKQPAVYQCCSSMACVLLTRRGACSVCRRGG
eukprot:12376671-Alexandrium_andersonii.AAC.1